jgi:hypothetical protein
VREKIDYRFRVSSAVIFTLYSYSKALEYRFRVRTADSITDKWAGALHFFNKGITPLF